jgi:predicted glutamine amidotransferase
MRAEQELVPMSSAVAVITRDPNLMRCELLRLRSKVRFEAAASDATVGVGYVHGSEVLLRKKPGPTAPTDLYELGKDIEADAVVCFARGERVGAFKDENTQPFRYRRWLFAHAGSIEAIDKARPVILNELPEYLRRQVRGTTDGELALMHFFLKLPAKARTDDGEVPAKDAARALGEVARMLDGVARSAGATRPSTLNLIATNGRVLVAARLGGDPLFYAPFEGIARCDHCGILETTPDTNPLVRSHRMLRSVAIATDIVGPNTWIEVPTGHGLAVGRNLDLHVVTI